MIPSRKQQAGIFASVALLLSSGICLAKPPATNPGAPFEQLQDEHAQIQAVVDDIPTIIQITNDDEMDLLRILERRVTVQGHVDTAVCATAALQCGAESEGPASDLNESPVRLFVQVSQRGRGVAGLSADAFVLTNPFFPAGGRAVRKCETNCAAEWFQDGGEGLYSIFLEPLPRPTQVNWKAGEYAVAIDVVITDAFGESRGTTMVTFAIPGALNVDQ